MATALPPTPPSPGVGLRRKGPKSLPRLPLSAFTPPNSGTSDKFPLPPSPSTVHPESVIDAAVAVANGLADVSKWRFEAGEVLGGRIVGIVLSLSPSQAQNAIEIFESAKSVASIVSVAFPFSLDSVEHSLPQSALPVSLHTVFTKATINGVESLRWALQQGKPVDITIEVPLTDALFDNLEDLLSRAIDGLSEVPPIILSNLLPPPDNLDLPIVKLMSHPAYKAFQARIAALSLVPQVFIKYLPPAWNCHIPAITPSVLSPQEPTDSQMKKEWKRRIKMYLGPVMEAFGDQRIIFGSSMVSVKGLTGAGDWYAISRESLAELGVEQEAVDAVFFGTAKQVYGTGAA
ncbi:uncharacterized protein BT62DRAFT_986815 [Guyanagaster necrorhizus]|uniref:Uncharacterized protein n=1 Tax=Guyanagaster necrorhizus TaxID=856835 RepID=A0A9P7VTA4_9AGAR|nr:uncharacterized protein BT62DRAFT_986815 [Guyanagaster necrorhizus MCA 3950]KAG7446213.1 hypothetical protein BT62DRAFT_986815 [Guyanagaster necrorhizus MCA 3950]